MLFKCALVYFLAVQIFSIFAEDYQAVGGERNLNLACSFHAGSTYGVADLLQCVEKLAAGSLSETTDTPRGENIWSQLLSNGYLESLFGSPITNFFNKGQLSPYQTSATSSSATSSHYQSNYPGLYGETSALPSGIGANLLDAIFSISRHDDYKCVPRILCEAASGKIPGADFSRQLSSFLGNMGVNTFSEWLSKIDLAQTSPILNFARAIILGYGNRGDSYECYRAFPKCPRDQYQLVNYLNNYNGGFFQFFNKVNFYRPTSYANLMYTKIGKNKDSFPASGFSKADRNYLQGPRPDSSVWRANAKNEGAVYWKDRAKDDYNTVRFPNQRISTGHFSWNRNSRTISPIHNDGIPNRENEMVGWKRERSAHHLPVRQFSRFGDF